LLRDILRGDDPQITALLQVITAVRPDVLHLTDLDYDLDGHALTALQNMLATQGLDYPYRFTAHPNSGLSTPLDMDGDGRLGGPGDAQGFGFFRGQGGMAILSRFPIPVPQVRDFSGFLWADLPGATAATRPDGTPFPSTQAFGVQRLSSVGHWDVPVILPNGTVLHLLAFHATTPVFDGPEDHNGWRNHDELEFWRLYLENALPDQPADAPFVLLGDANLDPADGEGRQNAIRTLLAHPMLQDPAPESVGGALAANTHHTGRPGLDTADWGDPVPGNLRVDYVLPAHNLTVQGAGVFWPAPDAPLGDAVRKASRHRLVWVDLVF